MQYFIVCGSQASQLNSARFTEEGVGYPNHSLYLAPLQPSRSSKEGKGPK